MKLGLVPKLSILACSRGEADLEIRWGRRVRACSEKAFFKEL